MNKISYTGYRFPPEIIHQAIWLYLRFTLSLRDVEDLLAERGVAVSYETVRRWMNHFGPMIAADLRKRRLKPHTTWHLDEVYLKIDGRMVYLWRAVDAEGEVLDVLIQSKRNKHAALKLLRKLLKKYAFVPERLVTDDLRSYSAAVRELGIERHHERGRWKNNRAENSHQPTRRRERKMQRFKSPGSAQKFLSTHAAVYNTSHGEVGSRVRLVPHEQNSNPCLSIHGLSPIAQPGRLRTRSNSHSVAVSRRLHQYPACGGWGSRGRDHSSIRLFRPYGCAVRPPGSTRNDQVLEDLRLGSTSIIGRPASRLRQ